MDMNDYTFEVVARDRLAELRAEAARLDQFEAARPGPRPLWDAVGRALVRMGTRRLEVRKDSLSEVRP
jgi:hypothetical protein